MSIRLSTLLHIYPLLYCVLGAQFIAFMAGASRDRVGQRMTETGSPVGLGLQGCFILATVLFCAANFTSVARQIRYFIPVLIISAYTLLSALWSIEPALTARRGAAFLVTTIFACVFAGRYRLQQQLKILNSVMAIAAVSCVIVAVFLPTVGIDHTSAHFGDWQGIYDQKNGMAAVMVEGLTLVLLGKQFIKKATFWSLFLLYSFLLIKSGSREAWIAAAGVTMVYVFLSRLGGASAGLRAVLVALAALLCGGGSLLVAQNSAGIFRLLNRSSNLTGRTAIWRAVWLAIKSRPILGYGFDSFWLGLRPGVRALVQVMAGAGPRWIITSAHDGPLEVLLELGTVGLVLTGLLLLRIVWRAFPRSSPESLFALMIVVSIALNNIVETYLLVPNGVEWLLLVIAEVNLAATLSSASTPARSMVSRIPQMRLAD
jgi:exopolysaccharide production protein ExoQ